MYRYLAALVAIGLAPALAAQGYPAKPVRIVVPFSPGSTIDIIARIMSPRLQESMGQTVLVENRSGAGGVIGMDLVTKAAPDGYTFAIGGVGQLAMTPALYPTPPYDPAKDFSAVSMLVTGPLVIAIHPSMRVNGINDLVALARKRPGQINFGSPGVGTSAHLAGELFKNRTRIDIVHVPYKGNSEAITDLVGGQLTMVITGLAPVVPLAKAGKVRVLVTTGRQRIPSLPDVPAIGESGIADAEVLGWYGMVGPRSMPKEVVARMNLEIANAMRLPEVRERYAQQSLDPDNQPPEHFAQVIQDEYARWTKVIRSAGIRLEQ